MNKDLNSHLQELSEKIDELRQKINCCISFEQCLYYAGNLVRKSYQHQLLSIIIQFQNDLNESDKSELKQSYYEALQKVNRVCELILNQKSISICIYEFEVILNDLAPFIQKFISKVIYKNIGDIVLVPLN